MLSIVAGVTMDLVIGLCMWAAAVHTYYTCVHSMQILNGGKTALKRGRVDSPPPLGPM